MFRNVWSLGRNTVPDNTRHPRVLVIIMISHGGNSIEWNQVFQSTVYSLVKCVWIQSVRMLMLYCLNVMVRVSLPLFCRAMGSYSNSHFYMQLL